MDIPRLYITGFSGSGKSTLAKVLSERSGLPYEDLDANIEINAGFSIREIFSKEGEASFRQMEATALRKAIAPIIATGGGILCLPKNRAYMKATGRTLLLSTPFSIICERLSISADRPLVSDKNSLEIKKLLFARAYAYNSADYCIDTGMLSLEEVAEKVIAKFCLL